MAFNWLRRLFNPDSNTEEVVIEDFDTFYDTISNINRAIDLLINSIASVHYTIYRKDGSILEKFEKNVKLQTLLEYPSTEIDRYNFYKTVARNLLFTNSCLIYNTRLELQIIEKFQVEETSNGYNFWAVMNDQSLKPLERDNCVYINLVGKPGEATYIDRIQNEKQILQYIYKYLSQYFKNNSFIGIILKTERTLSDQLKKRYEKKYKDFYNLLKGKAFSPAILDGGDGIEKLVSSLKDTDIPELLKTIQNQVFKALGIPPLLIDSGNNANIRPNLQLFYYTTVLPVCESIASAFSLQLKNLYRINNAVVKPDLNYIKALQADLTDITAATKNLYTVGLITKNEARKAVGYPSVEDGDTFLIPRNITGEEPADE